MTLDDAILAVARQHSQQFVDDTINEPETLPMFDVDSDPHRRLTAAEQAELTQLVNDRIDAKATAEKALKVAKDCDAVILARLRPGERWEVVPGVGVAVREPSRSYSPKLAQQLLTDQDIAACTITTVDPLLVKQLLKKRHQLDQAMQPGTGDPTVAAL